MVKFESEFTAAGGNRHPSAADWDHVSGLVAVGSDRNVALWNPLNNRGLIGLLCGHLDTVNAVKFLKCAALSRPLILSGSVDKTIRVWDFHTVLPSLSETICVLADFEGSVIVIEVCPALDIFASGSADGKVKMWHVGVDDGDAIRVSLLQNLPSLLILAVAGTHSSIQVYSTNLFEDSFETKLPVILTGHEGWIRSLAFIAEPGSTGDLLLSSASQDKYIRLWRVHQGEDLPLVTTATADLAIGVLGRSLSNKTHKLEAGGLTYFITFEALLLGHEDWIYTASWFKCDQKLRLLSASADNSLAIWEADPSSGVWVCLTRLGEISGQKGATTATGSTGGYWIGLWSPDGKAVTALGRTGAWRLWSHEDDDRWVQRTAVSGHTKGVSDLAWAPGGEYLLSTSSDQTTRLFAQWKRPQSSSWHEFSRPQIHGYDLNCIDSIIDGFISGADEKLLRVFDQPRSVSMLLHKLCGIEDANKAKRAEAASIPVLGLSNKAVQGSSDEPPTEHSDEQTREMAAPTSGPPQDTIALLDTPPLEDHLARHTLWPETEKLYGHGYEISAVAASHDHSLVATACRASSIDHAVIRLFETQHWREIKPALTAHSLTVTRLRFRANDSYLLSVGRDRRWALFKREEGEPNEYRLAMSEPKGHARMILDASWAPIETGLVFATAGRDKQVRMWHGPAADDSEKKVDVRCAATVSASLPVTAIDFLSRVVVPPKLHLAVGLEDGSILLHTFNSQDLTIAASQIVDKRIVPSRSINRLAWRPCGPWPSRRRVEGGDESKQMDDGDGPCQDECQLALASEDSSVRIYSVSAFDEKAEDGGAELVPF